MSHLITARRFESAIRTIKQALREGNVTGTGLTDWELHWPTRENLTLEEVMSNFLGDVKIRRRGWESGRWVQYFDEARCCFHMDQNGERITLDYNELNALDWEIFDDKIATSGPGVL